MTTKEALLLQLLEHRDSFLSGAAIAAELGVSRNAVHKAANELREKGVLMDAAVTKGYRLAPQADVLSADYIKKQLGLDDWKIQCFDAVDSTNQVAKELALNGEPGPVAIISAEQTAGRGRRGRVFHSPKHGLYLTMLVRPRALASADGGLATTAAAVAVCGTLADRAGIDAGIKWVNDVFIDGKKVCGILTEAGTDMETGDVDWMAVGIGLNLTVPEGGWPEELRQIAGEIFKEGHQTLFSNEIAIEIIRRFAAMLPALGQKGFLPEYRRRSILPGKKIMVLPNGRDPYPATAIEIDDECRLVVELPDGTREALLTGEVSTRLE